MSPTTATPRRSGRSNKGQPPSPPGSSPKSTPKSTPKSSPKQSKVAKPATPRTYTERMGQFYRPAGLWEDKTKTQALRDDLAEMGYDADEAYAMSTLAEPEVDNAMQIRTGTYAQILAQNQAKLDAFLRKQTRRAGVAKKTGNSPKKTGKTQVYLAITSTSNWVLFDPVRGFPPTIKSDDVPPTFKRFSKYQPGNAKILTYNIKSFAVALRKTPAIFEGQEVQYTKQGPKLVNISKGKVAAKADSPMELSDE